MRRQLAFWGLVTGGLLVFFSQPAFGIDIKINGDINNRFEVTNNAEAIATSTSGSKTNDFSFDGGTNLGNPPGDGFLGNTDDDSNGKDNDAEFGETKARLWLTASSDDNNVKGVWAVEVGSVKYGAGGSVGRGSGGGLSGDGVNTETRWLYVDFQNPLLQHESRLRTGLQPITLNPWLWTETAMGVRYYGTTVPLDYEFGWMRAENTLSDDSSNDDLLFAKLTWKPDAVDMKLGVFGVYYTQKEETTKAFDLTTAPLDGSLEDDDALAVDYDQKDYFIGVDGELNVNRFFLKWDLIYQGGEVEFDENVVDGGSDDTLDRSAYFLHADAGMRVTDAVKGTFTYWYASGDDDADDDKAENYDNIDTDVGGSVILFDGDPITDDNSFTDAPYLLDKGFQMYRARVDWQISAKLTTAFAGNYMLLAEEALNDEDVVGWELDFYSTYEIWKGLTWNVALGYLFAGDALDAFTSDASAANGFDGDADDIYRLTTGLRYKF